MLDVVGLREIAIMFDVPKATANQWRYRRLLPEADALNTVWERKTLLRWGENTGRPVVYPDPFDRDAVAQYQKDHPGEPQYV
jgi:hypothetical protein